MDRYNHKEIEQKWQKIWDERDSYLTDINKETEKGNFYLLDMFPYPSGDGLHMGHTEGYSATDILYRYKKMQGFNVLHPQGFDSFGLPAENYAIKTGTHPAETTKTNGTNYLRQWSSLGLGHDFKNIFYTSDPEYYRWTQWLFGQFYDNDLVYKKTDTVNWCDSCNTTIANEQVEDGNCERCDSEIIQKAIPAWFFKITDFADALIDDLDSVDWPEPTKKKQINWIGRSVGSEIEFQLKNREEKIKVFTTRADTLFGATYLVLAPEHSLIQDLSSSITNIDEVQAYIDATAKKTELDRLENKEKTGVQLQGITAINPANNEEIPVYTADYALVNYATGAVMAVPAHDERDFEFATKFELPIKPVVKSDYIGSCTKGWMKDNNYSGEEDQVLEVLNQKIEQGETVYKGSGSLCNSSEFNGLETPEAKTAITKKIGGEIVSTYRLRDWSISRQRYWGCPIPMVYDSEGNAHFVGEENLPWLLPTDVDFVPTGVSPLAKSQELKDRVTKLFGEGWTPEVDTMDTFVDSSWYFLRYPDLHNTDEFCSKEVLQAWQPVDLYIGGAEHTYMHLLYARFFVKALNKIGIVDFKEPFKKLRHQGMVNDKEGKKMSKSKGNVVNPDDMVERFGADAVRTYMMFAAPLEDDVIWNEDNIVGVYRFLEKVWGLQEKIINTPDETVEKELNKLIKAVGEQIEGLKYNTAVSDMMKFINLVTKQEGISQDQLFRFLQLLSPYAPHIADEISESLGGGLVLESTWPVFDEALLGDDMVTIGVQVNGKRRGDISIAPDASEEIAMNASRGVESISKWLEEGDVKKVIYIPGKILNIIVG